MKKFLNLVTFAVMSIATASTIALTSCSPTEEQKFDVTFYNGETVLKVEKVEKGKTATEWTPEVSGYEFQGWYKNPTFTHEYTFDPVTENTSVFGKFLSTETVVDTREFYIVGSGTSPILLKSDWGKNLIPESKLTKAADKNEYTITLDLYTDDQFQFAINTSWHHQRGVGYIANLTSGEEEIFANPGSAYGNDTKRSNIKVVKSGKYKFTLTTNPNSDYYDTEAAGYSEENKEAFNVNDFDSITWERLGDVEAADAVTSYYIKGSGVTEWKDIYNSHTQMVDSDGDGIHNLSIFMKKGEQFLFTSRVSIGDQTTTGTTYLKASSLSDTAKTLFDGEGETNMVAKATGTYDFAYNEKTKVLDCTYTESTLVKADYYVDGTFGEEADWNGYCFNENYKLARKADSDIFEIENVSMKADSEFIIQKFKEGSTERGEWGTEGYNGLGSYNSTYLVDDTGKFEPVSSTNKNIKVLEAGNYTVSFNEYSQIMTITPVNVTYDIYIKGSGINNWNHEFSAEYRMILDEVTGNYSITLDIPAEAEFGFARFLSGVTEGYGDYLAMSNLGNEGDANDTFKTDKTNFVCQTAGTYKIVYTTATEKLDFYVAK